MSGIVDSGGRPPPAGRGSEAGISEQPRAKRHACEHVKEQVVIPEDKRREQAK